MPYSLPIFNVSVNIWHTPNVPPSPPDLTINAQFYVYSRSVVDVDPTQVDVFFPPIWIRVPMGTDLRATDLVEVAAGSGIFYTVIWVERIHLGFPNEYFAGIAIQGVSPPPPSGDAIIQEGGDYILQESGDKILVE